MGNDRCPAKASAKRGMSGTHTIRCQLDSGHDGMHRWADESRRIESMWFGPAVDSTKSDTRWRYGLKPHA